MYHVLVQMLQIYKFTTNVVSALKQFTIDCSSP